jgi:hypothetical protein
MIYPVRCWPLFVLLAVALSGCAGHHATASVTQPMTALPAYRHISWAEAKALIRECRAREVGQTHSRLVTLSLRDGGRRYTREPHIDDVVDVVNRTSNKCGPITFATE